MPVRVPARAGSPSTAFVPRGMGSSGPRPRPEVPPWSAPPTASQAPIPARFLEDFGKGQLECGQAEVTLDPDFAAVVRLDDYHVFLTGYDGQSDLSVCERTSSGFQVRATSGTGSGSFSWRVVAKRKDVVGERLATVTMPPEPQLPTPPSTDEDSASPIVRPRAPVRQQRVG
jgi:hypothetical protein